MVEFYISDTLKLKYKLLLERINKYPIIAFGRMFFKWDLLNILAVCMLLFDVSLTQRCSLLFRPKCWLTLCFSVITLLKVIAIVLNKIVSGHGTFKDNRRKAKKSNEKAIDFLESYTDLMNMEYCEQTATEATPTVTQHSFQRSAIPTIFPITITLTSPVVTTHSIRAIKNCLAITIFHRLADEFDNLDAAFHRLGFIEIRIGFVPWQRLEKFADMPSFVHHYAPTLPIVLKFLRFVDNQIYLVERTRALAFGNYLSDFKPHPTHLCYISFPPDSAIIFHAFCIYMDELLMAHARAECCSVVRPFFERYVVMDGGKQCIKDVLNNYNGCAIYCSDWINPIFDFICHMSFQRSVQSGYNVFTVIYEFLLFLRVHYDGFLDGVDLNESDICFIFK